MKNLNKCYAADFETITDVNDCRIWAYGLCNINNPSEFIYGKSMDEFMKFCGNPKKNYNLWFHNLKFDGSFIIDWLLNHNFRHITDKKERSDKTFSTLITDMGQFYEIIIYFKVRGNYRNQVDIKDSMKIFPGFSVEEVADGFKLPISKLTIDYNEKREIGHELTEQEVNYLRNDVEIMSRALKEMFSRGLTKMTIASDAMNDYRHRMINFRSKFPELPPEVDKDIRKAYRGGFTYVNEVWKEKEVKEGLILDVNSLYPSCMTSPYELPYGQPVLFEGKYSRDKDYPLYIQSFTCAFEIKPGKIPSVQVKNSPSFIPNEYLKTTNGERITLYLTKPDLELFREQYNISNIVYNGGWKFKSSIGLFDDYVNFWTEQKIKAGKEGNAPLRQIAKLMLNSLYGRFGISGTARQKAPYLDDKQILRFYLLPEESRETCYVAAAAYITSYGRKRTIETSQIIKDYTIKKYGEDRYYYSDTDSIHCTLTPEDLEELKDIILIDDYKLGYWAKEAEFTRALYIRQKCYIEMIEGRVDVTVAGLPKHLAPLITFENFKRGFTTGGLSIKQMKEIAKENGATLEEQEKIHHKLTYKYVPGGVVLTDTDFTIK